MPKVYRVYEMYQTPDAVGTTEYGVYASREEATKRAYEVWDEKGWPKDGIRELPNGSLFLALLHSYLRFEFLEIKVQEYDLGMDIEKELVKYKMR